MSLGPCPESWILMIVIWALRTQNPLKKVTRTLVSAGFSASQGFAHWLHTQTKGEGTIKWHHGVPRGFKQSAAFESSDSLRGASSPTRRGRRSTVEAGRGLLGRPGPKSSVRSDARNAPNSFLFLVAMPGAPFVASLRLVVTPGATSSVPARGEQSSPNPCLYTPTFLQASRLFTCQLVTTERCPSGSSGNAANTPLPPLPRGSPGERSRSIDCLERRNCRRS